MPENRFGLAVMTFFRDRKHDKGWSFMVRFFAMMGIMRRIADDAEMRPYVKKGANGKLEFHKAVFEVAATQKLESGFEFDSPKFLEAVKQAALRLDAKL